MSKSIKPIIFSFFLCVFLLFSSSSYCEYDTNPATPETPDPRAVAIKPTLLKLNKLVIVEVENGIAALQRKDVKTAIEKFITVIGIEPYDPMAYILLMKTLISIDKEDMAYQWLEKSGRNLSDSNQIISNLNTFLKETPPLHTAESSQTITIAPFKDNKLCAVSFVFDDGEPSISTEILPMFEKYGFHTTVAINPGVTPEVKNTDFRASWSAWRKAKDNGHEIANHGMTHRPLPGLSDDDLRVEAKDSFQLISKKIGMAPSTFVFPQDEDTPELIKYIEQDHLVARDHDTLHQVYPRICIPIYGGKRFSIPTARILIDIAMNRRLWLIPQCHGLFTPTIKKSFKAITKNLLADQLEYLKQNSDKIWVGRFIDVYKYLKEVKETELTILKSTSNSAEFSVKNNLDKTIFNQPLTILINFPADQKPNSLKAFDVTNAKEISARIINQKIVLDVIPEGQTIRVEWK